MNVEFQHFYQKLSPKISRTSLDSLKLKLYQRMFKQCAVLTLLASSSASLVQSGSSDHEWCKNINQYMANHNLSKVIFGHAAKTGGSCTKQHFGIHGKDRSIAHLIAKGQTNCNYNVIGTHLWYGLEPLLQSSCAADTFFLISARDKMSWLKSVVRMKCDESWKNNDCERLKACMQTLPGEMRCSPADWFKKKDFLHSNYHVALFDFHQISQIFRCYPNIGNNDICDSQSNLAFYDWPKCVQSASLMENIYDDVASKTNWKWYSNFVHQMNVTSCPFARFHRNNSSKQVEIECLI